MDGLYCIILNQLRIPRLNYSKALVLLQIVGLCFLDGVMFGGVHVCDSMIPSLKRAILTYNETDRDEPVFTDTWRSKLM